MPHLHSSMCWRAAWRCADAQRRVLREEGECILTSAARKFELTRRSQCTLYAACGESSGDAMHWGQLVVGPPGSGKTTYCRGMYEFLNGLGR
jgi:type II secretory ATPase GspE/PulE/Tfp pilus assembly ATPase PilB-like protein